MLGARIANHREIVVTLHRRLAQALQLNLYKADLFVYQALEIIELQVISTLAAIPITDGAHGAAEITAADIFDIKLDWEIIDLRTAALEGQVALVVGATLRRTVERKLTLSNVSLGSGRWFGTGKR